MTIPITTPLLEASRIFKSCKNDQSSFNQYVVALIATFTAFVAGLNASWITCNMPRLLSPSNPNALTSSEGSILLSMGNYACVPGIVLGIIIGDWLGRVWSLRLSTIPLFLAALIFATTDNKYYLYFTQILYGIGFNILLIGLPAYLTEISSTNNRGNLVAMFSLQLTLGQFLGFVISPLTTPEVYGWIVVWLAVVLFFLAFALPESPYFLLLKHKDSLILENALKKLNLGEEDLNQLKLSEISEKGIIRANIILDPTNFWAMKFLILMLVCHSVSGSTPLSSYSQVILQDVASVPTSISGVVYSSSSIVSQLFCMTFFEKFRRKTLLISASAIVSVSLFFMGLYYFLVGPNLSATNSIWSYTPLVGLVAFNFASGAVGAITMVFVGELFPSRLKSTAACIFSVCGAIMNVIMLNFYQIIVDNHGKTHGFWTFLVMFIVMLLIVLKLFPETRGFGLDEIQVHLSKRCSRANIPREELPKDIFINVIEE